MMEPEKPTSDQQQKDKEQDKMTAGQRRINFIWEFTQATIAVIITLSVVYCDINKIESEKLTNAFFLIISMYFVRTNHSIIGGIGYKTPGQTR